MSNKKSGSFPRELLQTMEKEIMLTLKKHTAGWDGDILPLYATLFLSQLGYLLQMVMEKEGIRQAKNLREKFCQRIHAFPLDEVSHERH